MIPGKSISKIGNIDWSRVVWPPWLWRSSSSTVSWPKPIPASCETLPLSLLFGRRNILSFSKKSMNSYASDPIWSTENWQFWWRGNFNAWIYRPEQGCWTELTAHLPTQSWPSMFKRNVLASRSTWGHGSTTPPGLRDSATTATMRIFQDRWTALKCIKLSDVCFSIGHYQLAFSNKTPPKQILFPIACGKSLRGGNSHFPLLLPWKASIPPLPWWDRGCPSDLPFWEVSWPSNWRAETGESPKDLYNRKIM